MHETGCDYANPVRVPLSKCFVRAILCFYVYIFLCVYLQKEKAIVPYSLSTTCGMLFRLYHRDETPRGNVRSSDVTNFHVRTSKILETNDRSFFLME